MNNSQGNNLEYKLRSEKANQEGVPRLTKKMAFPEPPPAPSLWIRRRGTIKAQQRRESIVPSSTRSMWDRLFEEGYRADVCISTDNNYCICPHASILGMASPVTKNTLTQVKANEGPKRRISIRGVPHQAVHTFIRYLYYSSYEEEEMNKYSLHLIVLSHVFVVPNLKRECARRLEKGLITTENVIDIYQLARLCDIPRLCLICYRLLLCNFKSVSAPVGWNAMKQSNPELEKELMESVVEDDLKKQERVKKVEERMVYLHLYEAMEALVHICCDGCMEALIRHFAGCKTSPWWLHPLQENVAALGVAFSSVQSV